MIGAGLFFFGAVAVADAVPAFPVRYSENHRFLVGQNGIPFPIKGRTAWFVLSLGVADYRTFLDDTVSRGHNAIELHVINHDPRGNHPPYNGDGALPFARRLDGAAWDGSLVYSDIGREAPDFTTPNEAYWSFVDDFLTACDAKGILVFLFPTYVGYPDGKQGWLWELVANGPDRMRTYGAWIAKRFQHRRNLVWMMGGDMGNFNTAEAAAERGLLAGLHGVPNQQSTLFSAEWQSESIGTDQPDFGTAMTLNSDYSWSGAVCSHGRRAYAHRPTEPAFLLEEPYDQEGPDGNSVNPHAIQPVRRFQWRGWLSTIGGYISGNGYVWPFKAPAWREHLDTQGSRDMACLNRFIDSIRWQELVPSGLNGMRELVGAGGGSVKADDYVAAAATPDGALLVAYVPPAHAGPMTVDLTALRGPVRARWFNPASGEFRLAADSLPNTEPHRFVTPGDNGTGTNDWVLVCDRAAGEKH